MCGIVSGMRVAIVGGPGIGKSTLVRQLGISITTGLTARAKKACGTRGPRRHCRGRNPVGVTAYFGELYDANYCDAAAHDGPGQVIFFEGARITLEAHIAEYPAEHHERLREVLAIGDSWNPDRVIVLTSSTDTVEKHIRLRNRTAERAEQMVERFRLIDAEFRRLAPAYPNTVVINRDHKEFHHRSGLMDIITAARLPPFPRNSVSRDGPLRPCAIRAGRALL